MDSMGITKSYNIVNIYINIYKYIYISLYNTISQIILYIYNIYILYTYIIIYLGSFSCPPVFSGVFGKPSFHELPCCALDGELSKLVTKAPPPSRCHAL